MLRASSLGLTMRAALLVLLALVLATPASADHYFWADGDGLFSNGFDWRDVTTDQDHSGPPGAADLAEICSGCTITLAACAALGVPTLASAADYASCLARRQRCAAEDLTRLELPRAAALLATVGRAAASPFCP